jgi:two-component sensor histidine kinase
LILRLPQRLAGKVPPPVVEFGVGLVLALSAVLARYALTPLIGEVAPYVFVSVAMIMAALVAGWRSGLVALLGGQLLTFYLIIWPSRMLYVDDWHRQATVLFSTFSEILLLLIVAVYQREIDVGVAEREKRLNLLDEALKEIDHRTRNNYQTVLAMIDLQARRATDGKVRDALRQVADRIEAISNASGQLAVRSADLGAVRLDDHLCGLVEQIERGLSRDGINVECDVEQVTASADAATSISIIVNELVTNAIKHAFNGEASGHVRVSGRAGREFELIVADDGRGIQATRRVGRTGLGTQLVENFARQLGASHEVVSSDKGTIHRLLIPRLD